MSPSGRTGSGARLEPFTPALMLVVDMARVRPPAAHPGREQFVELRLGGVRQAIAAGVNMVQLRAGGAEDALAIGAAAATLARYEPGCMIFCNTGDDMTSAEVAESTGTAAHLREFGGARDARGAGVAAVRARFPSLAISRSVHSTPAAVAAEADGADLLVLGTVFASASHPGGPTTGLEGLHDVCAAVSLPVIGIGGMTAENAGDAIAAGAAGVAVVRAIFDAQDPGEAAAALRAAIDSAWAKR